GQPTSPSRRVTTHRCTAMLGAPLPALAQGRRPQWLLAQLGSCCWLGVVVPARLSAPRSWLGPGALVVLNVVKDAGHLRVDAGRPLHVLHRTQQLDQLHKLV